MSCKSCNSVQDIYTNHVSPKRPLMANFLDVLCSNVEVVEPKVGFIRDALNKIRNKKNVSSKQTSFYRLFAKRHLQALQAGAKEPLKTLNQNQPERKTQAASVVATTQASRKEVFRVRAALAKAGRQRVAKIKAAKVEAAKARAARGRAARAAKILEAKKTAAKKM